MPTGIESGTLLWEKGLQWYLTFEKSPSMGQGGKPRSGACRTCWLLTQCLIVSLMKAVAFTTSRFFGTTIILRNFANFVKWSLQAEKKSQNIKLPYFSVRKDKTSKCSWSFLCGYHRPWPAEKEHQWIQTEKAGKAKRRKAAAPRETGRLLQSAQGSTHAAKPDMGQTEGNFHRNT